MHCGIRFLTHPRNAGRQNLRCPFGCRQQHRRQRSNQRSTAYYQTPAGRRKKKLLNGRRKPSTTLVECQQHDPGRQASPVNESGEDELPLTVELRLEGVELDELSLASSPMLPYVRMVVSLIEGIQLTCREVLHLLRQSMRQRSFGVRRKIDYILGFLHQHPP
jgi:hypothetical protein